ncbi:MAG TPA: response regulator transcription factor [Solirubrobacteraceae bacterium]|nr:response regulator transcription factor [Solirubrobacteraceae bacterium]
MDNFHSGRRGGARLHNFVGDSGPGARIADGAIRESTDDAVDAPLRVAIMDSDSGFLVVLSKRLEQLSWQHRMLPFKASAAKTAALDLDILIVDLASLGGGRWKWLERLCEAEPRFGVVVCTGASTVAERVHALRIGVDDWLSKPCHPEELIARVEAVAARLRPPEPRSLEPVVLGEVEVRPDQYQAFVAGRSLELTRREFQLIELLCDARGEVLGRELIYETLWGYEMARNDRSVDVFVHKLRRKLKEASPEWRYVHTHPRTGYRLAAERALIELPVERTIELPVPLAA